ncbi:DHFS-FPGS homolog B, partial [Striga asiatica]
MYRVIFQPSPPRNQLKVGPIVLTTNYLQNHRLRARRHYMGQARSMRPNNNIRILYGPNLLFHRHMGKKPIYDPRLDLTTVTRVGEIILPPDEKDVEACGGRFGNLVTVDWESEGGAYHLAEFCESGSFVGIGGFISKWDKNDVAKTDRVAYLTVAVHKNQMWPIGQASDSGSYICTVPICNPGCEKLTSEQTNSEASSIRIESIRARMVCLPIAPCGTYLSKKPSSTNFSPALDLSLASISKAPLAKFGNSSSSPLPITLSKFSPPLDMKILSGSIRILPPSHIELRSKHLNQPPLAEENFRWGSALGLKGSTRSENPFPKYASHDWGGALWPSHDQGRPGFNGERMVGRGAIFRRGPFLGRRRAVVVGVRREVEVERDGVESEEGEQDFQRFTVH